MIKRTIRSLPLRVHPAFLMMLAMHALGGDIPGALSLLGSLAAHECGHIWAAKAMRVKMVELELMPFGGAARLENAWSLRPGQMALVALAGPAANALILGLTWIAWRFFALSASATGALSRVNAMLMLFNLLPALPLDGGRVLCGLIGRRMSQARAARIGVIAGRSLAGILLALCALTAWQLGSINLSMVLAAAFLIAAGPRERAAAASGALLSLVDRQSEMDAEGALPIRWLAATPDTSLTQTIAQFRPRALHRVAVYDQDLSYAGIVEEQQLLKAALTDAAIPIGHLITTPITSAPKFTQSRIST